MQTGLSRHLKFLTSEHSDAQPWASECPDVKNYKWRLNPVWQTMLYSCTHMTTVDVKGSKSCMSDLIPNRIVAQWWFATEDPCIGLVVLDDWAVPSLLVASDNHILRLLPDAVGTRSYNLLASYSDTVTSLAVINSERTVFFATAGNYTAFIGRFSLSNPSNL